MKRSSEEYHAAATLLGLVYWEQYHAFYPYEANIGEASWLDADTLEVIGAPIMLSRLNKWRIANGHDELGVP